jgi:pimeloyl-ACP methyl ester carboxylesterase
MRSTQFGSASRAAFVFALLLAATCAHAEMRVVSEGKATQVGTDEIVVHSNGIGRDFLIEVTRPMNPLAGEKMPAVYALDGGFGIAGPMVRMLGAAGRIPQAFAISIGYPNEQGRYIGPRNTDLIHIKTDMRGGPCCGGGAAFEEFLMKDVRPYIESHYPVDPGKSVLLGHSAGGMFAATVLVQKPDSFGGYVIGGLPIKGDPTLLERGKAVAARGGNRRVFIGYSPGDVPQMRADEFAAPLSGAGSTFIVRQVAFPEDDHNTSYIQLVARGLPFVLPTDGSDRTAIELDPEMLQRYVGTYRADGQITIHFTRDGKRLFGSANGGQAIELFPESAVRFFARTTNSQVVFEVENGKAVSARVRIHNSEQLLRRVD